MAILDVLLKEEKIEDEEFARALELDMESDKPHWLCPPCDHICEKKCTLRKSRRQVLIAWDADIYPDGCPDFCVTLPCTK